MKMPSINIAFKEKGISAIERSERSNCRGKIRRVARQKAVVKFA